MHSTSSDQGSTEEAVIAQVKVMLDAARAGLSAINGDAGHSLNKDGCQRLADAAGRIEGAAVALERGLSLLSDLRACLADRQVVAREAEDRIADGLQIVSLMLLRQAEKPADGTARDALHAAATRVDVIAYLYATLSVARVGHDAPLTLDLGSYLSGLCSLLSERAAASGEARRDGRPGRVAVYVQVDPWTVSPLLAQRLGFIVAELLANARRHAFPSGRPGTIQVTGSRDADDSYRLCVKDDGAGLPRDFDLHLRRSGFGLRMVLLLADHLHARVTADTVVGARFVVTLPAPSRLPA